MPGRRPFFCAKKLGNRFQESPPGKLNDAVLALLGLLLAFTFSMSMLKHEQRRQMVVADSNAIGEFYNTASQLKEPVRGKLCALIRRYAEHQLSLAQASTNRASVQQNLLEAREMHRQMRSLVGEALDNEAPVAVQLTTLLNQVTSAHGARMAAYRDRLPSSVVLILCLAAVTAMILLGWQHGATNEHRSGAVIGFAILVSLVLWLTLDLNQPRRGLVSGSQEPMQQALAGMQPD
ncbi:MAG TPA: hypothetical protein VKS79_09390 [Gemmataceae bacterium]|nr:hypothetical protein [Gemmataceae bacterium]